MSGFLQISRSSQGKHALRFSSLASETLTVAHTAGSPWTNRPLTEFFSALEKRSFLETLFQEVAGINLPRILFAQTRTERDDVLVSEAGNTGVFAGTAALDWLLRHQLFKKGLQSDLRRPWIHTGSSVALISFIFSLMLALPFVRNLITATYRGKTDYSDIVSEQRHHMQGHLRHQVSHQATDPDHQRKIRSYQRHIYTITGLGMAGTLLGLGIGLFGRGNLPKALARAQSKFGLANGEFRDLSRFKAVMYWGVPVYAGWIQASREPMELYEQLAKFAGFVAGFWGIPQLIRMLFSKRLTEAFKPLWSENSSVTKDAERLALARYDNLHLLNEIAPELTENALKLLNQRAITKLIVSVAILGTMPLLLNLKLRPRRLALAEQQKTLRKQRSTLSGQNQIPPRLPTQNTYPSHIPNLKALPSAYRPAVSSKPAAPTLPVHPTPVALLPAPAFVPRASDRGYTTGNLITESASPVSGHP